MRLSRLAPLIDAACLAIFVLLGRESHGVNSSVSWYFLVVWPFLAGWFVVAVLVRLYSSRPRVSPRLALVAFLGIALGMLLRVAVTHRDAPVAFVVVAYAFIVLSTFGWRILARLRPRATTG